MYAVSPSHPPLHYNRHWQQCCNNSSCEWASPKRAWAPQPSARARPCSNDSTPMRHLHPPHHTSSSPRPIASAVGPGQGVGRYGTLPGHPRTRPIHPRRCRGRSSSSSRAASSSSSRGTQSGWPASPSPTDHGWNSFPACTRACQRMHSRNTRPSALNAAHTLRPCSRPRSKWLIAGAVATGTAFVVGGALALATPQGLVIKVSCCGNGTVISCVCVAKGRRCAPFNVLDKALLHSVRMHAPAATRQLQVLFAVWCTADHGGSSYLPTPPPFAHAACAVLPLCLFLPYPPTQVQALDHHAEPAIRPLPAQHHRRSHAASLSRAPPHTPPPTPCAPILCARPP